jgi:hypothetical protein
MDKISNTTELRAELTKLIRSTQAANPSRTHLAEELRTLSRRLAGRVHLALKEKNYPDGEGPSTPWGPAQSVLEIARGVRWVHTAGHGGLGVASGLARKQLTPAARRHGALMGGYFWYEEDVAFMIPLFEVPAWSVALSRGSGSRLQTQEQLERGIRQWYPKYFEMGGLVDKPKLTPGMKLECVDAAGYTSAVPDGSTWEVGKVTSSTFIATKEGGAPTYRFRLHDYVNTDKWQVAK